MLRAWTGRASQSGGTNYNAAPDVDQSFTVNKGTPVITWSNPASIVYGAVLTTNQLNATAKVGVQYTTYDSLPGNEVGPYIDLVGSYTYLPGSYVQLGVRHTRNATDIIAKDQESTSVYASVNHRFTREITGSLIGQYQYGVFSGGSADGLADNFLSLHLDFARFDFRAG